jgi:5'-nucleotidase
VHILLTNDDGITSRGLFEAKRALERHGSVSVIAPDSNRSGSARSITIDRPLTVAEVELRDGSIGFATDGTPVDCVRFGELGLVGERPDLIVSGINYGYNLGDDVTYSGTVAAAFEGILLGIQGIAISQGAPTASGSDFRRHEDYDFGPAADFLGELVGRVIEHGLPDGTVLNVNVPSQPDGVAVGRLGKRIYADTLEQEADAEGGLQDHPPREHRPGEPALEELLHREAERREQPERPGRHRCYDPAPQASRDRGDEGDQLDRRAGREHERQARHVAVAGDKQFVEAHLRLRIDQAVGEDVGHLRPGHHQRQRDRPRCESATAHRRTS